MPSSTNMCQNLILHAWTGLSACMASRPLEPRMLLMVIRRSREDSGEHNGKTWGNCKASTIWEV